MIKNKTIFNNLGSVVDQDGVIHRPEEGKDYRITIEEFQSEDDVDENEAQPFMNEFTFIKSFRGNGIMLTEKLTPPEVYAVVFLTDFICYKDCVLRKNGNLNGHALDVRELSNLIGIKYETFRKTMGSLKKKGVIGYHSTGSEGNLVKLITVNPYIFLRGCKIQPWIANFYANTEWANLDTRIVKKNI